MEIDIKEEDLPFEDEVQREPYKVRSWLRYVDHKKGGPARIVSIIYERAVRQLPGSYKLWKRYLDHRSLEIKKKNPVRFAEEYRKVGLCYERALLHLHKMPRIWVDYVGFLTRQADVTVTRRAFDRALRALPVTQHGKVWDGYLRFAQRVGGVVATRVYKRYLAVWPNETEQFVDYCVESQEWAEAARTLVKLLDTPQFNSPRGTTAFQLWKQLAQILRNQPQALGASECGDLDVEAILRDGIMRFGADRTGELWVALASHFIARGEFEMARDVFEEAVGAVGTVRDFTLVFDAYAEFEESTVAAEMEAQVEQAAESRTGGSELTSQRTILDLRLHRLERLMDRRPFMVSDVVLKQQPHSVQAWLQRVELWKQQGNDGMEKRRIVETFEQAVATVDPHKAVDGKASDLWRAYAQQLENGGDVDGMRGVLDRAVRSGTPVGSVAELADLFVWYAEKELELGQTERALQVLTQATAVPRTVAAAKIDYRDESAPAHHRVCKALKVWSLLVDIRESMDEAVDATRATYDRMLELRIATPQTVVNYADFLDQHRYYEDSFKVFERGIDAFGYPVAIELWNIYLRRFVDRYGASKLERTRDLFEQALDRCPDRYAKPIFLAYGQMEEKHGGLARRALRIYERATKGVARDQRLEMFQFYAARTAELLGPVHARPVYERGIEDLPDAQALELAIEFAQIERQLGEIDRARALYAYASQFADPRVRPQLWTVWNEFEVRHGNEDTFKDMLRVKRSVQARFNTDAQFLAAAEIEKQKSRTGISAAGTAVAGFERQTTADSTEKQKQPSDKGAENPDEVDIDFDDDDDL
ncbi:pre-mRNA-splicing factor syf1 [Coemansia sp. RSA 1933]|nr:pre-mRNA-splicing factor syf1 [Coemansia sp. RSA 1933]